MKMRNVNDIAFAIVTETHQAVAIWRGHWSEMPRLPPQRKLGRSTLPTAETVKPG